MKKLTSSSLHPSLTWLTVFLPVLSYFIITRLRDSRLAGKSIGKLVQSNLVVENNNNDSIVLQDIFYLEKQTNNKKQQQDEDETSYSDENNTNSISPLKYALHLVLTERLDSVIDTIWRHDEEIGRGYLLVSQSSSVGRIWRWEVGGGPITIGRTLHMEPSGCRSKSYCIPGENLQYGSGAIALDFSTSTTGDNSLDGQLVVSEWGEKRIVRMETSGARTPLIINVPSLCSDKERRLYKPHDMIYTAFGHLIIADYDTECNASGLYYLENAMTGIDPLPSMLESRYAHDWNTTQNHKNIVQILYSSDNKLKSIGGLLLDASWTGLYALVRRENNTIQLLHLSFNNDDDDDEQSLWNGQTPDIIYQWNNTEENYPGSIVMDHKGTFFIGIQQSIVVMKNKQIIASLPFGNSTTTTAVVTSLTIGEDGYLYATTNENHLMRILIRTKPMKLPTNLIPKKKKIK